MKIRRKGLIRLWIVLSVIWTVGWSVYMFHSWTTEWANVDSMAFRNCSDPYGLQPGQTLAQCLDAAGVNVNYFEREHTTALAWWSEALGASFLADILATALLVGLFYVARWVVRGFSGSTA